MRNEMNILQSVLPRHSNIRAIRDKVNGFGDTELCHVLNSNENLEKTDIKTSYSYHHWLLRNSTPNPRDFHHNASKRQDLDKGPDPVMPNHPKNFVDQATKLNICDNRSAENNGKAYLG